LGPTSSEAEHVSFPVDMQAHAYMYAGNASTCLATPIDTDLLSTHTNTTSINVIIIFPSLADQEQDHRIIES